MASLQSSLTVLTTTPNPRTSSFRKPSQLSFRKARVSCSGGGGRVDRRNMLLGLGGLYGSSSLVTGRKAEADPLLPPEMDKCDPKGATVNDPELGVITIDANCCPRYVVPATDYKLPETEFSSRKVRPPAHRLSSAYLDKYKLAIKMMKELDKKDPDDPRGFLQQANIHCAYCNGPYDQPGTKLDIQVHNSWIFFPFHRWYLYFFERICGELIGDPTFALPYWNWDHPDGMYLPPPFAETYSPLYDCNRDQTHWGEAIVSLNRRDSEDIVAKLKQMNVDANPKQMNVDAKIKKMIVDANLKQMNEEMIVQPNSAIAFMGQPYRARTPLPGNTDAGTCEAGSHRGIHGWTGNPENPHNENMGNFYSAGRDPIFYCHHANVDRMWTIWSKLPAEYSKTIDDPDFLDAAFLFYDEKKKLVRVTVRDCLDNTKMGYGYQYSDISPWLNYTSEQRVVPANVQQLSQTAQTAGQAFPSTLTETIRVVVHKPAKGKADEVLVLQSIETDSSKLIEFDVYVNDDENDPNELSKPERAGGFTQIPHRSRAKETPSDLRISLKKLYENINIADDDEIVVVTVVPRTNGDAVTIGGIKIAPRRPA